MGESFVNILSSRHLLAEQSAVRNLAAAVLLLIVVLMATSLVNWLVVYRHQDLLVGQVLLYGPLFLAVCLSVLIPIRRQVLKFALLFFALVLVSFAHSAGPGSKGFLIAASYFVVVAQLVVCFRLQKIVGYMCLVLVVGTSLGLVYELIWADLSWGSFSISPNRSALFYINPNLAATALCFLSFAAVTVLRGWWRGALWLLVFVAVLTTGSRSVSVALTVVLFTWLWFRRCQLLGGVKRYWPCFLILSVVLGSIMVVGYQSTPGVRSVVDRNLLMVRFANDDFTKYISRRQSVEDDPHVDEQGRSVGSRFARSRLLVRAWDVYWLSPWVGHGVDRAYQIGPHNLFIFWSVAIGILGWLVFPVFLYWVWRGRMQGEGQSSERVSSTKNQLLVIFLILIGFFIHDIFVNPSLMVCLALAVFSVRSTFVGEGVDAQG